MTRISIWRSGSLEDRNFNRTKRQRIRLSRVDATGPMGRWGGRGSAVCSVGQRLRGVRRAVAVFAPGGAKTSR